METIIYQGQPVEVELVNYLSGTIPTSTVDAYGDEELFRDSQGRYYLRRQLELLADYHEDHGEGNIPASGRTLVHRINVNAAILWATTRLNSERLDLRNDAAKLLMEGRGYSDPHPSHLSAEQRAMVANPAGFAEQSVQVVNSGRITVELDDLASAMLRKTRKEGDACRHPGENLRDLVNAAVTFYLCDDHNDEHGEFDLSSGEAALERAKRDRLQLEAAASVQSLEVLPALTVDGKNMESFEQTVQTWDRLRSAPLEKHAEYLGACLARVRAQIDAVDQAEGEDAAADLRTLHVDLFNALRHFGQVFAVDVRTLLRVPVEMDGKIVQPPPIPDSERDVHLDAKAAALVNRYSEQWGNKVADIVNGALHHCLETEALIPLEDAIDALAGRRLGFTNWIPEGKPEETVELPIYSQEQLAEMGKRGGGYRFPKPNPADVALLAASAPEEEPLPEETHTDEPGEGTATPDGEEGK